MLGVINEGKQSLEHKHITNFQNVHVHVFP